MKKITSKDLELRIENITIYPNGEYRYDDIAKNFKTEDDCKTKPFWGTCNTCGETACATVNACKTLKNCDTIMNGCPANTKDDRCHPYSRYDTQCCVTVGVMECEQSIEVCPLTEVEFCFDTKDCSGNEGCLSEIYCHVTQDDTCDCAQPIE